MVWTIFEYLYRDAGNFKAFGSIALEGRINNADRESIRAKLNSGEFFVAEQIGVPPLYEQLYQWSDGPTASDHCWHEFLGFRETDRTDSSTQSAATVAEFAARFNSIVQWDGTLSPHFEIP